MIVFFLLHFKSWNFVKDLISSSSKPSACEQRKERVDDKCYSSLFMLFSTCFVFLRRKLWPKRSRWKTENHLLYFWCIAFFVFIFRFRGFCFLILEKDFFLQQMMTVWGGRKMSLVAAAIKYFSKKKLLL